MLPLLLAASIAITPGMKLPHSDGWIGKPIEAKYDRFKDHSLIALRSQPLARSAGKRLAEILQLTVFFQCEGDSVCAPDTVWVDLEYSANEWRFLREGERSLIFLVGGERFPVNVLTHHGEVGYRGWVTETMLAMVDRDLAVRLLSEPFEGQIGTLQFSLDRKAVGPAREFASLLQAAATADTTR